MATTAVASLMEEHRLIEQVLGSMETFMERLVPGGEAERARIAQYADFLQNFADKCHHGKEEDRLFVRMNEYGFPKEYGPVAVMLADHVEGRGHVAALAKIGGGQGPLTADECNLVSRHASAYIALLRAHILKEDNILYPMAEQAIPALKMEELVREFDAFETEQVGLGTHERFHALAESLIVAFPPDPAKMTAGSACVGCAGHM